MRDALTLLAIGGAALFAWLWRIERRDRAFWKERYETWYESAVWLREQSALWRDRVVPPHPLRHRTIRVEASCPADAIDLLLTSARQKQEDAP
jgi:hypothetical protein